MYCQVFCKCSITNNACVGREIGDPDDESSRFFSRGKITMNVETARNKCPVYGVSKETFASILKDRLERELKVKLENLNK